MPLIPIPKHEQPEKFIPEVVTVDMKEDERVRKYLDIPDWICPKCGLHIFGRTPTCAYCKQRLGVVTRRV